MKRMLVLLIIITLLPSLYAQEAQKDPPPAVEKQLLPSLKERLSTFLTWINSKAYARNTDPAEERKRLRQAWKEAMGVDVFYPHYKVKEIEEWAKNKASVKVLKIKGKPEIRKNSIKYIFKIKF